MYVSLSTLGNIMGCGLLIGFAIACLILAIKLLISAVNPDIYNTKSERVWDTLDAIALLVSIIAGCFVSFMPTKHGFISMPSLVVLVAGGIIFIRYRLCWIFRLTNPKGTRNCYKNGVHGGNNKDD